METRTLLFSAPPRPQLCDDGYWPNRQELKVLVDSLDKNTTIAEYARAAYLCGEHRALHEARQLHTKALRHTTPRLDPFLARNIVRMFLRCGSLIDAKSALEERDLDDDVTLWTETIAEHARRGIPGEALLLFRKMLLNGVAPNKITFLATLNACSKPEALAEIHARIAETGAESNPLVATTLIHRYSKLGCSSTSDDARRVFDKVRHPDVFVYNVMVTAYARDGFHCRAVKLFRTMQLEGVAPDKITFLAVLDSCREEQTLGTGRLVHGMIVEAGLGLEMDLSTLLIGMYSKCGSLDDAKSVFAATAGRDEVFFTAMVEAHARRGSVTDGLHLILEMQQLGIKPGRITFTAALDASSGRATQRQVDQLRAAAAAAGFQDDPDVATALVNSYGKSGQLRLARETFEKMEKPSGIAWSSLIAAYSHHGHVPEVLELFAAMQQEGHRPSSVTFLCVLSACSHGGLVYRAVVYFASMIQDYGLIPQGQHYGCVIDMFGRSGQVGDAEDVVKKMPVEPDPEAWMALLRACQDREMIRLGQVAGKSVLELDPGWESGYVALSGVYVPHQL